MRVISILCPFSKIMALGSPLVPLTYPQKPAPINSARYEFYPMKLFKSNTTATGYFHNIHDTIGARCLSCEDTHYCSF